MFYEYRDNAGLHGRGGKQLPNGFGDVLNLRMALHRDRKMVSEDRHRVLPMVLSIEGIEEIVARVVIISHLGLL